MRKLNFDLIIPIFNEGYTIIKLLKIIKKDLKKKNLILFYVMTQKKIIFLNI